MPLRIRRRRSVNVQAYWQFNAVTLLAASTHFRVQARGKTSFDEGSVLSARLRFAMLK